MGDRLAARRRIRCRDGDRRIDAGAAEFGDIGLNRPGGSLAAISGVVSGNVAPLIEDDAVLEEIQPPAGVELPSGVIGEMVPVALPLLGIGLVAAGASGSGVIGLGSGTAGAAKIKGPVTGGGTAIAGAVTSPSCIAENAGITVAVPRVADVDGAETGDRPGTIATEAGDAIAVAPPTTDIGVRGTGAVPTVIDGVCAGDGEQLMLVPAAVASSASGTGARVVTGTPGWFAAEKGLGPVRGEETIAASTQFPWRWCPWSRPAPRKHCRRAATQPLHSANIASRPAPVSWSVSPAAFAASPCCLRPD
jgi:hypothetical protein